MSPSWKKAVALTLATLLSIAMIVGSIVANIQEVTWVAPAIIAFLGCVGIVAIATVAPATGQVYRFEACTSKGVPGRARIVDEGGKFVNKGPFLYWMLRSFAYGSQWTMSKAVSDIKEEDSPLRHQPFRMPHLEDLLEAWEKTHDYDEVSGEWVLKPVTSSQPATEREAELLASIRELNVEVAHQRRLLALQEADTDKYRALLQGAEERVEYLNGQLQVEVANRHQRTDKSKKDGGGSRPPQSGKPAPAPAPQNQPQP